MQNQVILSIGSNQGDKLAHIEQCFHLIQLEIGDVVKVSDLYLSPSWGFESDDFYNCALMLQTSMFPEDLLAGLQKIEEKIGREKKSGEGYEARVIDIDIVDYNGNIFKTEHLQIPHPYMQDRLFVLLPMRDVVPGYNHPTLGKTISELIQSSKDDGSCKSILKLKLPG